MLSPRHIGLIAIASDLILTGLLSVWMRPHFKNRKVSRISEAPHDVVAIGKSLSDFGTVPLITILLNAWQFAFAYGLLAVLICNYFLPSESSVSWIIAVWMVFLSLVFMCAFCNNGIHVVTSHAVHFVYYFCGFIPMALFKANPTGQDGWILWVVILARLTITTAMKYYIWPDYPSFYKLYPLFTRTTTGNTIVPFSTVQEVESNPALKELLSRTESLKRNELHNWIDLHIPFAMYEILTIHVSSWFASGAVVSWIVYGVLSKAIGGVSDGLFFGIVGAVSVAYVGVFVWWAPLWLEVSKWITLTHYYPRGTAVFCFFMGVGIMSTQLIVSRDGNGAALAIVVFAHLFHVIGLGLYGFACAAIVRVSKSFKSLFPQTRSENTSLLP